MENTKLSPPWWEFYHKLMAMFGQDEDIHLEFDEADMTIKMYVDNQAKADALGKVLPEKIEYGKITLKIEIIPSDDKENIIQLYKTIFSGNPVFSKAIEIDEPGAPHFSYVIFKPGIVQFFNDNLTDAYGNLNALYQDIARDVFTGKDGVYFCTEQLDDDE